MKPPIDELKKIAVEFGFRYTKKDVRWKIEKMCVAIWNNRRIILRLKAREETYKHRVKQLEDQLFELDKLRG